MKYIGLVDVDKTSFPNLVLMKLATYYKAKGYGVTSLIYDMGIIEHKELDRICEKAYRNARIEVAEQNNDKDT